MAVEKDTIEVGDLITSSRKGYYRVARIERRFISEADAECFNLYDKVTGKNLKVGDEFTPLVQSRMILNSKFHKQAGADYCDIRFCAKVSGDILVKIEKLLQADPSIEENSLREYHPGERRSAFPQLSDQEAKAVKVALKKIREGETVEAALAFLSPQSFAEINVANGYVHNGKQFALRLNDRYILDIVYDELPGNVTRYVRGEVLKV